MIWGRSPEALLGDLLAVAGGALAGLYTLAGGKARQSMTTGTYTTLCYGMCAALVAVLALFSGQPLTGFDAGGWLGIIAITVCAQLVGHTAFNHLLATMSPLLVSMIILLEIPGAALLAAVFLNETLPAGTYAGLALILVGLAVVVLGQRSGANRKRRAEPAAGTRDDEPPSDRLAELGGLTGGCRRLLAAAADRLGRVDRVDGPQQLGREVDGEEDHHGGLEGHLLHVVGLVRPVEPRHVVAVVPG